MHEIIEDYRAGRIDKPTAIGRFNRLCEQGRFSERSRRAYVANLDDVRHVKHASMPASTKGVEYRFRYEGVDDQGDRWKVSLRQPGQKQVDLGRHWTGMCLDPEWVKQVLRKFADQRCRRLRLPIADRFVWIGSTH
jgi:hypothetical protein